MAKANETGLFKLDNGFWAYRIVINRKDHKVDTTCRQDDNGNPFKTKRAAKEARALKLSELKKPRPATYKDAKLIDIYAKYMANGAVGKATSTVRKQESMWDNHIKKNFGNKYLSEITLDDLTNYLQRLYTYGDDIDTYTGGYAYKYVEGFLKFFYLLFGVAYRDDLIDPTRYTKMFVDKGTRLSMPDKTQSDYLDDEENAKAYTMADIAKIEEIFKRGNCYTAFLLGFYLGLRISECFALRYSDIDWIEGTVKIQAQMLYEDGLFCLCPVKTLKSVRVIDIPEVLYAHLYAKERDHNDMRSANPDAYRNTEVVLDKTIAGMVTRIVGGDFVNRKDNGELLTNNSIKYWTKAIKAEKGIDFKYHGLRKTHATILANLNTPALELMNRLGHKKYETTLAYYINQNHLARKQLIAHINRIDLIVEQERQHMANAQKQLDKMPDFRRDLLAGIQDVEAEN